MAHIYDLPPDKVEELLLNLEKKMSQLTDEINGDIEYENHVKAKLREIQRLIHKTLSSIRKIISYKSKGDASTDVYSSQYMMIQDNIKQIEKLIAYVTEVLHREDEIKKTFYEHYSYMLSLFKALPHPTHESYVKLKGQKYYEPSMNE